jgi:hypothetical protein
MTTRSPQRTTSATGLLGVVGSNPGKRGRTVQHPGLAKRVAPLRRRGPGRCSVRREAQAGYGP